MPVARPESSDSRVIAHVDMDCFYVQVEQRKQPNLRGQPTAVVQYNNWKGGGLIAVGYEARKFGVKRSMRGDEAKEVCPQIHLVQVPVNREAAERMLAETPLERLEAINEEALKSHILGLEMDGVDVKENVRNWLVRPDADRRDKLLACGALLVAELRLQVLEETQFTCSAGIAHNKVEYTILYFISLHLCPTENKCLSISLFLGFKQILAKLASGMNKPSQQTVVPSSSVTKLLQNFPIKKMKQLGGKLGTSIQTDLAVETVGDLLQFPESKLQELYGVNTGTWLWNIARGISGDEVEERLLPKSHGAGKTFPGCSALRSIPAVENWLKELSEELSERLQSDLVKNKRIAQSLTVHASAYKSSDNDSHKKFPSKSGPLRYGTAKILEDAILLFQAGLREYLGSHNLKTSGAHDGWGITGLSVSASKIVAIPSGTRSISNYFQTQDNNDVSAKETNERFDLAGAATSFHSESEIYTEVHFTEPDESPKKEKEGSHALRKCGLVDSGTQTQVCIDKQASQASIFYETEPTLARSMSQQDGFAQETKPSSSGARACSNADYNESEHSFHSGEFEHNIPKEPKTSTSKQKGTPSILKFFQRPSSSTFQRQEHPNIVLKASPEQRKSQAKDGESIVTANSSDLQLRPDSWSYNADEIDPAILSQLPLDIQEEVNAWMRPQKRANTTKKASNIAHYFLPTKGK
ncbi:OLC1v1001229C4 [Oldenlandia corymbosa var. corymbosa]|uniref:DNA polymerase eta n=1 Tax=Oldenlandia corymbosa var. corymbosa TaxID=529605 RepID=A0AAV1D750_OLDCO|nr:OLC1v1001229C4 [Oldenlandia corymbosa var. corymbosa]